MNTRSGALFVAVGGSLAGLLTPAQGQSLRFEYLDGYAGPDLSVCMPLGGGPFEGPTVKNWFDGILPDDDEVRESLGIRYGCQASDTFTLLAHIGWDAPGAVQVFPEQEAEAVLARPARYLPISEDEIAARLAGLRRDSTQSWELPDEHWSVGGMQAKIALARFEDTWYQAAGSAATTHLVKPGVRRLPYQALDEAVSMRLGEACGIPTARTWMHSFGNEWALVVERYDRMTDKANHVTRIHQEDFCQALGVSPTRKYSSDGGPTSAALVHVLKEVGDGQGLLDLIDYLIFNNLIGATDGHAKNYSLLHFASRSLLAPQYDVASALPYLQPHKTYHTALSLGGENRIGWLRGSSLDRAARVTGVEAGYLRERARTIGELLLDNVDEVLRRHETVIGIHDFADHFRPRLCALVETTLSNLAGSGHTMRRPDFLDASKPLGHAD